MYITRIYHKPIRRDVGTGAVLTHKFTVFLSVSWVGLPNTMRNRAALEVYFDADARCLRGHTSVLAYWKAHGKIIPKTAVAKPIMDYINAQIEKAKCMDGHGIKANFALDDVKEVPL
jgi:hypothetical protein